MNRLFLILLFSVATTAQAQIAEKGLILDLDADKGVEVEDGDRVVLPRAISRSGRAR